MDIAVFMVRVLAEAMERSAVPIERLLEHAGLPQLALDDSRMRLSLADFGRIQRAALELSGDPALGLHIGEAVSVSAFDLVGHLAEHATTLRQALTAVQRFAVLLAPSPILSLVETADVVSLRLQFPESSQLDLRLLSELAVSGLLRIARRFSEPTARPRGVFFQHQAPAHLPEYRRIFGDKLVFGHPFTGLDLERAWLDRKQLYANADLYATLAVQAESELHRNLSDQRFCDRVRDYLAAQGPARMPSMDEAARHFDLSERSLRRRLRADGASYREIVDGTLAAIAKRLLAGAQASVKEVGFAMGFETTAGFHRAFKRWTTMTPQAYRRSLARAGR